MPFLDPDDRLRAISLLYLVYVAGVVWLLASAGARLGGGRNAALRSWLYRLPLLLPPLGYALNIRSWPVLDAFLPERLEPDHAFALVAAAVHGWSGAALRLALGVGLLRFGGRLTAAALWVRRSRPPSPQEWGILGPLVAEAAGRMGVAPPRVRVKDGSRVPAASLGFLRPTVILADHVVAGCSRKELLAVLGHEMAHLRRRGAAWAVVTALGRDLLFFCPTTGPTYRSYRLWEEHCCDALWCREPADREALWAARRRLAAMAPAVAFPFPCFTEVAPAAAAAGDSDAGGSGAGRAAEWALAGLVTAAALFGLFTG